jgi:hypothetical protein
MRFIEPVLAAVLFICFGPSAFGHECVHVGGGVITNIGVITADRTLGVATGDLKGAVGVQIVGESPGMNGTTVFSVHHFWVTDAGDTIFVAPAQLTAFPVTPGLFAVVTYPISISGGTGKFKGATGKINAIGEADFNAGEIGLRYGGRICFATSEE